MQRQIHPETVSLWHEEIHMFFVLPSGSAGIGGLLFGYDTGHHDPVTQCVPLTVSG